MMLEEHNAGAVTVLRAVGSLSGEDTAGFTQRGEALIGASLGRFIVDASRITFVDSAGLEGLLTLSDRLEATGQSLRLCGAGETLREVLEITGLSGNFEFYADVNSAVRSFL